MEIKRLTERETQIARCVAKGYTNKQIGRTLYITENTVKNHVHSIIEKLGVSSRVGIAAWVLVNPKMVGAHAKPLSA